MMWGRNGIILFLLLTHACVWAWHVSPVSHSLLTGRGLRNIRRNMGSIVPPASSTTGEGNLLSLTLNHVDEDSTHEEKELAEGLKGLMERIRHYDRHVQPANATVFCNVELNCAQLEAVGFDMDYTLAQYNEELDRLAFELTKKKLVEKFNYPDQVLDLPYNGDQFRRGLVVDRARGNVLLVDEHRYVRMARHGMRKMSAEERKGIYTRQVASFAEKNYVNIDTVFLIVDAAIFMHLVTMREDTPHLINKSYEEIYKLIIQSDVRDSVELVHRDGEMKGEIMKNPSKYIRYDEDMVPMLQKLRSAGKKTFLLTNSMWDYTDVVMRYLVQSQDQFQGEHWKDLFDVVIVGANKPAFIREDYLNIFGVTSQGLLSNIEDKSILSPRMLVDKKPEIGVQKVFQGGCWQDLHRLLGIANGQRILYVGDHLYSDILRSKRTLGWRTCLVLPELEKDIVIAKQEERLIKRIRRLRRWQLGVDALLSSLRGQTQTNNLVSTESMGKHIDPILDKEIEAVELKAVELKKAVRVASDELAERFPGAWGPAWQAGPAASRLAAQARSAACLLVPRAASMGLANALAQGSTFRPPPSDETLLTFG